MKYHEKNALAAKKLRKFIASRPEGVTYTDIKEAGLSTHGLGRLQALGAIKGTQIKEPENGPKAYHWLFTIGEIKDA